MPFTHVSYTLRNPVEIEFDTAHIGVVGNANNVTRYIRASGFPVRNWEKMVAYITVATVL